MGGFFGRALGAAAAGTLAGQNKGEAEKFRRGQIAEVNKYKTDLLKLQLEKVKNTPTRPTPEQEAAKTLVTQMAANWDKPEVQSYYRDPRHAEQLKQRDLIFKMVVGATRGDNHLDWGAAHDFGGIEDSIGKGGAAGGGQGGWPTPANSAPPESPGIGWPTPATPGAGPASAAPETLTPSERASLGPNQFALLNVAQRMQGQRPFGLGAPPPPAMPAPPPPAPATAAAAPAPTAVPKPASKPPPPNSKEGIQARIDAIDAEPEPVKGDYQLDKSYQADIRAFYANQNNRINRLTRMMVSAPRAALLQQKLKDTPSEHEAKIGLQGAQKGLAEAGTKQITAQLPGKVANLTADVLVKRARAKAIPEQTKQGWAHVTISQQQADAATKNAVTAGRNATTNEKRLVLDAQKTKALLGRIKFQLDHWPEAQKNAKERAELAFHGQILAGRQQAFGMSQTLGADLAAGAAVRAQQILSQWGGGLTAVTPPPAAGGGKTVPAPAKIPPASNADVKKVYGYIDGGHFDEFMASPALQDPILRAQAKAIYRKKTRQEWVGK
jgi:hypothetical protein